MIPGFIGTGAITEHVILGLMDHGGFEGRLLISERNTARSSRLAQRYPNIKVEDDNQAIVDQADTVFIATLPEQAAGVLAGLRFRSDQTIVSMAAMISVAALAELVAPATRIHRIIPMPPNEIGLGPIPIFPSSRELESLLETIGTVVAVEREEHFSTFSASSAIMATFFELVATNARWIQTTGVSAEAATRYSTAVFHSLATQATSLSPEELQAISVKCLTAGGLNEQLLNATTHAAWYDQLTAELNRILERVR